MHAPQVSKESTDDYVGRMQGYVLLLAAVTQSDNPANPHGLSQAWAWLARWAGGAASLLFGGVVVIMRLPAYAAASGGRGRVARMESSAPLAITPLNALGLSGASAALKDAQHTAHRHTLQYPHHLEVAFLAMYYCLRRAAATPTALPPCSTSRLPC